VKEILQRLNGEVDIIGSLVVTTDGMVVASALNPSLDEDTVAALASRLIGASKQSMEMLGENETSQFQICSSYGRMIFLDVGPAYLVVVTHENINVDQTMIAIRSAAYKITHRKA